MASVQHKLVCVPPEQTMMGLGRAGFAAGVSWHCTCHQAAGIGSLSSSQIAAVHTTIADFAEKQHSNRTQSQSRTCEPTQSINALPTATLPSHPTLCPTQTFKPVLGVRKSLIFSGPPVTQVCPGPPTTHAYRRRLFFSCKQRFCGCIGA